MLKEKPSKLALKLSQENLLGRHHSIAVSWCSVQIPTPMPLVRELPATLTLGAVCNLATHRIEIVSKTQFRWRSHCSSRVNAQSAILHCPSRFPWGIWLRRGTSRVPCSVSPRGSAAPFTHPHCSQIATTS